MSSLISPADLATQLADVLVLDVQYNLGGPPGRDQYDRGHLPGAQFVDLDADLADPPGPGGRHPLPAMDRLQATCRRLGIDDDTEIVVYDAANSLSAARAWWVLRYAGIDRVRVLDGGLRAWSTAGLPVTAQIPAARLVGTVTVRPGSVPMLDAAAAADLARDGLLLDARAAERYAGETEPIDAVAGHIPGAANAPMADYLNADGSLRPAAELRDYFAGKGVGQAGSVGTYCGSGVTAAHLALALAEIDIPAAVYVGSWSHWITDPARPIAVGHSE